MGHIASFYLISWWFAWKRTDDHTWPPGLSLTTPALCVSDCALDCRTEPECPCYFHTGTEGTTRQLNSQSTYCSSKLFEVSSVFAGLKSFKNHIMQVDTSYLINDYSLVWWSWLKYYGEIWHITFWIGMLRPCSVEHICQSSAVHESMWKVIRFIRSDYCV